MFFWFTGSPRGTADPTYADHPGHIATTSPPRNRKTPRCRGNAGTLRTHRPPMIDSRSYTAEDR